MAVNLVQQQRALIRARISNRAIARPLLTSPTCMAVTMEELDHVGLRHHYRQQMSYVNIVRIPNIHPI